MYVIFLKFFLFLRLSIDHAWGALSRPGQRVGDNIHLLDGPSLGVQLGDDVTDAPDEAAVLDKAAKGNLNEYYSICLGIDINLVTSMDSMGIFILHTFGRYGRSYSKTYTLSMEYLCVV